MLLAFELTMPGVNSCNGRWGGQGRRYVKVMHAGKGCLAKPGNHGYDFGDGWQANVEVREVDANEARRLRRVSEGFCGYDWMCDEIRDYGRIRTLIERTKRKQATEMVLTRTDSCK